MKSAVDYFRPEPRVSTMASVFAAAPKERIPSGWDFAGLLGKDVKIVPKRLQSYCFAHLQPIDVDLLTVAGATAFADRRVRRRSVAWARGLAVSVPVYECRRWSATPVRESLEEFLSYATGDDWSIEFRSRDSTADRPLQLPLVPNIDSPPESVLAYSAGLDSFAQLQHMRRAGGDMPFLITAEHDRSSRGQVAETTRDARHEIHSAAIPITFSHEKHAEETYRTRTFLFLAAAAVAARLTKARNIVIAENGQGSLGPVLVTLGREHPYRATYPGLTFRFRAFLAQLWGDAPPAIVHPRLWQTKGEVLALLASEGLLGNWRQTRSCSRRMKRVKGSEAPPACGLCGNCLLRRLSVTAGWPGPGAVKHGSDCYTDGDSKGTVGVAGAPKSTGLIGSTVAWSAEMTDPAAVTAKAARPCWATHACTCGFAAAPVSIAITPVTKYFHALFSGVPLVPTILSVP